MGVSVFHLGEPSEGSIFIFPLPNAQHRGLVAVGLNQWNQVNVCFCLGLSGHFHKKQEVYRIPVITSGPKGKREVTIPGTKESWFPCGWRGSGEFRWQGQVFILIHRVYYPFHALTTKRSRLKKMDSKELSLVSIFTVENSKHTKLEKIVY